MKTLSEEGKDKELLDIVKRMASIAEYNEPDSIYHRERVKGYCYVLARGMGLPAQEADVFAYASLLHDIGKVGIPEAIIFKSSDLLPKEWELVKQHPVIGAEILKGSSSTLLQMGEIIALTHHERWNGSGYPRGLKGEDIPLIGRIFAVADVFDALTTKRPYKPEITIDDATTLLKESAGILFDPKVIAVFLESSNEIIKMYKQSLV